MSRIVERGLAGLTGLSADAAMTPVIDELAVTLRFAGIPDPRRVAGDIIAALLDVSRSWPMMNRECILPAATVRLAQEAATMLASGAPFAYAVGCAQFRHLNLSVDARVLIPRPETEVLVGVILDRMRAQRGESENWGIAIDVGTGSGAIALSLASEGRFERLIATDVSVDALDVARANARQSAAAMRSQVEFRCGSLIAPVAGIKATLLVSNPPYISYSEIETLPPTVRDWEPPLALLSAGDGMAATAAIVHGSARVIESGGLLALEVDERRASLAAELVMSSGNYADVVVGLDLAGRERFIFASRV